MSFYYLCGRGYNQLARAVATITPGSADSILGAVASLYDYSTMSHFLFDGTNTLPADLNQIVNPGFEAAFSGGLPGTGWGSGGSATLTRESATPTSYEGTYHLKVAGAVGYAYFDQEVAAGETLNVIAAAYCVLNAGAGSAQVACQNTTTGKWLTVTDGVFSWQASDAYLLRSSQEAWQKADGSFAVESYTLCQSDLVTLRWYFRNVGGTSARFDSFAVWPRIDFAAVIAHNVPPGMTLALKSGATSAAETARGTFTVAQPTMHLKLATAADDRYVLLSGGAAPDARQVRMNEVVLGQARTLTRQRDNGAETLLIDVQDRSDSDLGPLEAHLRMDRARRRLSIKLKHPTAAEAAEWQEIMERSRNGAYPLLVVPDSSKADSAMLCRVGQEYGSSHNFGAFTSSGAELDELPFPALTS